MERVLATKPSVRPPDDYTGFLTAFGRGAGNLFRGTDLYYPGCLDFNDYAEEFAAEEDPGLVTDGCFFFCVHQGYLLYFFRSDAPGVWSYLEGSGEARHAADFFRSFVATAADHPPEYWEYAREQDRANTEAKEKRRRASQ
ncbi:SMI1/KNR4 family protein [Nocardiopsis ansamitocini]|uniref:SMI1/KNR4 family protein n=1 Tax=Nocardiopsis ansamitocini TaxID=1670832 RepID=A0A9W6UI83_9ACTN|nr:SMI1/KNR4 family protein [Nocardiopsis ansamitocini]GLU47148.1 hypothetical protein Nans01_14990 [Nocardiopsis ansamitocini]